MIEINCNGDIYNIEHDVNGNIYIKNNENLFTFLITNENKLELEQINVKLHSTNDNSLHHDFASRALKHSLKLKTINEIIIDSSNEELDFEENEKELIKKYVYMPEEKLYDTNEHLNEEDLSDDEIQVYCEPKYVFHGDCQECIIQMDESIYDTIIIDGKLTSTFVIFSSILSGDTQSYRITIYTSGYILLNIIGSKILTYKLTKLNITNNQPSLEYLYQNCIETKF